MFKLDDLNNPVTSALVGSIAKKLTSNTNNNTHTTNTKNAATNTQSVKAVKEVVTSAAQKSDAGQGKSELIESFFSVVGNNVDPNTVMDLFSSFVHDSKKEEVSQLAEQNGLSATQMLGFFNQALSKGSLDFNSPAFKSILSSFNPMADDDGDGISNLQESLNSLFGKYQNK